MGPIELVEAVGRDGPIIRSKWSKSEEMKRNLEKYKIRYCDDCSSLLTMHCKTDATAAKDGEIQP